MKKKILFLSILGMLVAGVFMFNACKKASPAIPPQSTTQTDADYQTAASDNSRAEQTFSDVFNASEDAVSVKGMNKTETNPSILLGSCTKVTFDAGHDSTKFPLYITIDFGTTGCIGKDYRTRKGKIHLVLTDRYRTTGAMLTATLDNFYVTDCLGSAFYGVEGTKTITNNGKKTDANGTYYDYNVVVTNGKITYPNGAYATWASTRERKEYVNSLGFVMYWMISGSANGVNTLGNGYTVDVSSSSPLKIAPACQWIEQGVMTLTSGGNSISIDFGNGSCDANATALINGKSYPFIMK